jgi:anthranilate phosphoribosyltransferase
MSIRDGIIALVKGQDLSQEQAAEVMEEIMTGVATPAQIGAFLTALHLKGETDAEIAGMASVMQERATPVHFDGAAVDNCGTGGDAQHGSDTISTFNISTAAAFVAAGAGVTVAKHGNRAASSLCGSADVLEGLGVKIELSPEGVARCLHEAGIGFMFAPKFHPAMRFVGPVRREIGIRTVFNVLGPLSNPARVRYQVLGVPTAALAEKLAYTLSRLSVKHALVVLGHEGMDEMSLAGDNLIYDVRGGETPRRIQLNVADLGLAIAPRAELRGGSVEENVQILRAILDGSLQGPKRDVVLLNAAAALVATEVVSDFKEGVERARKSIDSGAARARLDQLVQVSQRVA